jgi:hypothetical protein
LMEFKKWSVWEGDEGHARLQDWRKMCIRFK